MDIAFIKKYPDVYRRVADMVDNSPGLELCAERVISKVLRKLDRKFEAGWVTSKNTRWITKITREVIVQAYIEKKAEIEYCRFDDLAVVRSDGEIIEYQVKDVLANVEEKVFGTADDAYIEKAIALLAKDDREAHALKGWALGKLNTEIAEELAFLFDSKVSIQKVWLTRFKAKCKLRYDRAAS